MAVDSLADVPYYADFRDGKLTPRIGGSPTFARNGTRWDFEGNRFIEIAADIPRVVPPPARSRRGVGVAPAVAPLLDDSVLFDSTSTWNRIGVGSVAAKQSIFTGLPSGGEARTIIGDGTQTCRLEQGPGTASGGREIVLGIFEDQGSGSVVAVDYRDTTAGASLARGTYNFSTSSFSEVNGSAGAIVLRERGENGGETVLLWAIAETTSGNGRRFSGRPDQNGTGDGAIVHYLAGYETATLPVVHPYVGSPPASVPGEQFYVEPGPFSANTVQAYYLAYRAGSLVGDTGDSVRVLEHGDGSGARVQIREDAAVPGGLKMEFVDTNGNFTTASIDLGSPRPYDLIEIVYGLDPVGGDVRLLGRVGGGTVQDSGTLTPSSWTSPSGYGAKDRIVYGDKGDLSGSLRNALYVERHHGAFENAMVNPVRTGAAVDVMAEMAGVRVKSPQGPVVSTAA